MAQQLYNWLLSIPKTLATFSDWLNTPIHRTLLNISPLGLLGVAGGTFLLVILTAHVVRLFV